MKYFMSFVLINIFKFDFYKTVLTYLVNFETILKYKGHFDNELIFKLATNYRVNLMTVQ